MIPDTAWGFIPDRKNIDPPDWALQISRKHKLTGRRERAYLYSTELISKFIDIISKDILFRSSYLYIIGEIKIVDISVGFIPNIINRTNRTSEKYISFSKYENFAFGIVVGCEPGPGNLIEFFSYEIQSYYPFPIIWESRKIKYHNLPDIISPTIAVSACYVKPNEDKKYYYEQWSSGILSVRHAFGDRFQINTDVGLSNGMRSRVVEIDKYISTIDAAVIKYDELPANISIIDLAIPVVPGDTVVVKTSNREFRANVLRVFEHPISDSNLLSNRIYIDKIGVPGDSGSLVLKKFRNHIEAVGLYVGCLEIQPDEGIIQTMRQIKNAFELEIYI